MNQIDSLLVAGGMTYGAYRQLSVDLLKVGQTTGDNHSPAMLEYTRLNNIRMDRLDRTAKLVDATIQGLEAMDRPLVLLVLSEAWCGDAANVLPYLNRMVSRSEKLELRILLRDEHLTIMDAFLTNGTRSIPKIILLDAETNKVIGDWGPRPAAPQQMVYDLKAEIAKGIDREAEKQLWQSLKTDVQKWYNHDKGVSFQHEFMELLARVNSKQPS